MVAADGAVVDDDVCTPNKPGINHTRAEGIDIETRLGLGTGGDGSALTPRPERDGVPLLDLEALAGLAGGRGRGPGGGVGGGGRGGRRRRVGRVGLHGRRHLLSLSVCAGRIDLFLFLWVVLRRGPYLSIHPSGQLPTGSKTKTDSYFSKLPIYFLRKTKIKRKITGITPGF